MSSATLNKLCLSLALSCVVSWVGTAQAGTFADTIVSFVPGTHDLGSGQMEDTTLYPCAAAALPLNPNYMLGPRDLRFVSLGKSGSVTLAFSGLNLVDGPGDDFILWTTCPMIAEPGSIEVSPDGVSFVHVGDINNPPYGRVGYYDLAKAGVASAVAVRISSLPSSTDQGVDVDALQALHFNGPTRSDSQTWGHLKAHYH